MSEASDAMARDSAPEDIVIICFAGHGIQRIGGFEPGEYICPVETEVVRLGASAISDEELSQALRAIKAQRMVVLLDACHSGGVGQAGDNLSNVKPGLSESSLERMVARGGRIIIAVCRPEEVSWKLDDMRNGLCTHCPLGGLRGKAADEDGHVGILHLYKYLSTEVPKQRPQHPYFRGQLDLNFLIPVTK